MKAKRAHWYALFVAVIALLPFGCGLNETARLAARLDPVLGRLASSGAVLHARVIDLPSGRELYARRPDQPCTPASNFKLLTSAAGLDMFGPKHTFKTTLALDGDDLWIIGTGNPAPGDWRLTKAAGGSPVTMLEQWAAELEKRGIRRIRGDIVYDDWAFDEERVSGTWPKSWLQHWYAAPVTGLTFNDNCVDITISPTEKGQPARYEVMPPVGNIHVINECVTDADGSPNIVKLPGGNIYKLTGGCKEKTELKSKPVEDPGAFFADALRTQLTARGILVDGCIRRAASPTGSKLPSLAAQVIAVHETTIADVLSRINKNSQNLFAECLCKLSGQAFDAREGRSAAGSWASGGKAIRAFLQHNRIDDKALVPVDGSGLSPQNRVSTRILTDMLAVMYSRPDAEAYRASLTVAGVDGSLKDRMKGISGRVFGKTGYIGGVSSVTGYLHTHSGRWLAFSFIYNSIPSKVGDDEDVQAFTRLQDEACEILADWPRLRATPTTQTAPAAEK